MLDLDFAFLNLQNEDRKGLAGRKFFLDRLAPWLYTPRIERLVEVPQLGSGCHIHLPLGAGNVTRMPDWGRQRLTEKTDQLLSELKLSQLSVDRFLRGVWPDLGERLSLIWGDLFLKALAYTLVQETLSRRGADRIILAGDLATYADLLEALTVFQTPISVQTVKPVDYEVMTYRLLYERGCAVSNSYLNPRGWETGDLILVFDGSSDQLLAGAPGCFLFRLCSDSRGLAPELEEHLDYTGIGGWLGTMAPILESCLTRKGGIFSGGEEQDMSRPPAPFLVLQETADQLGVWDLFLDKAF